MSEVPSYATLTRPEYQRGISRKAIASLVLGILLCLPLLPSLLAILLGIGGMRATRGEAMRGRGLAIAGFVLGICGTLLWVVIGGFIVFLIAASQAPRAVVSEFAADLAKNDLAAAAALSDPTIVTPKGMDDLHTYIAPFGKYIDQTCTSVNLGPGGCKLSGSMRFTSGTHYYTATLHKSGPDWKIWGLHIY